MERELKVSREEVIFRLDHVTKIFGKKENAVKAVDDVSLEIEKGEIFGMIGMSGAGKSTLVRTLNGLESVTSGKVFFEGKDLTELKKKELLKIRQSIGMIFQHFNLLGQRNAVLNVELPMKIAGIPKAERHAKALEMLKIVGLESKEKAYPSELSGGQKQRLAIARALAMEPKVLLCDEATSALDPGITLEILDLLKDINEKTGITIVIITHEMDVVEKICDRVAILDYGRLQEVGKVGDIFTSPKSEAAKHLVYPARDTANPFYMTDRRCFRVAFDGHSSRETIICDLVSETGEKVNILAANTKSVGGIVYGQMIIEIPETEEGAALVLDYFKRRGVFVEEVIDRKAGAEEKKEAV